MQAWHVLLPFVLALATAPAHAASEVATVTLVDGAARVLRGATWYKLAPGLKLEEGDIVASVDSGQVQAEFGAALVANLAGAGAMYVVPTQEKQPVLDVPSGWLKVVAKAPGVHLRTPAFDVMSADAILVVEALGTATALFVEAGGARLLPPAAGGAPRDAKRGEFWSRSATAPLGMVTSAPRAFVDAMPRHFVDPLPVIATGKAKPALVADHDITYVEALPWLAGADRAVFERRFAVRLRDPAFRKAADADIARYPSWDRQLHPEKYAPKPSPPQ